MKELTLFYLKNCPYCKRARGYMDELRGENPAYAGIPLKMIEEREQKAVADGYYYYYYYYYVPTFYLGDEKISEGAIDKDGVKAVFERALNA